ncbi:glycosyltransferase family 9 protein [Vibrio rumoiensis]|uniref:glycosyltransferase family 9 protein n=1 Tax=Vibrio rumoiensis TaxID=76258 RepID=UPI00374966F2
MPLFSSAPASLCILRLSAIGDVCNTIAAVQCIQKQWPQTKITWITSALEAQLLEGLPNIEVLIFNKKKGFKGYIELWEQLKHQRFDALLHMQYALRASIATLGIKAKYKLGFDKQRSQDFQTWFTNVKVPSPQEPHVLDGLLAFAKELGVEDITPSWNIPYTQNDQAWANEYLSHDKNVVIVPAASKAYKNWTAEGYVDVIQHAHNLGWNIILAGSPAQIEIELAAKIQQQVPFVINTVGKSSIKQLVALIDKATMVIAPDTGPTHIANAMSTPVIGLYAHHNPARTGPYLYRKYVVSAYQDAIEKEHNKPVEQLAWRTRVKNPQAMNLISSEKVISMFDCICCDLDISQNNSTTNK